MTAESMITLHDRVVIQNCTYNIELQMKQVFFFILHYNIATEPLIFDNINTLTNMYN